MTLINQGGQLRARAASGVYLGGPCSFFGLNMEVCPRHVAHINHTGSSGVSQQALLGI